MHRALIAAALGASLAGPVLATEYTTYESITLTPPGAGGTLACPRMALLNLPAAWQSGDAVVVIMAAAQDAARDSLIAAMLAEHAAVLEVPPPAPAACIFGQPEASGQASAADAVGVMLGGLVAARRQAGGGLVVAIGQGSAGAAALTAAEEAAAAARLGPEGPRFAAALALGDGAAVFRLGSPVGSLERAGMRFVLLCDAIARSGTARGVADGQACVTELTSETPHERASQVTLRR